MSKEKIDGYLYQKYEPTPDKPVEIKGLNLLEVNDIQYTNYFQTVAISECSMKDVCKFNQQLQQKIDSMTESYETNAEAKFYEFVDKHESKLQQRIDKAIEVIEESYYSKNTTDIDSIVVSNNKLLQVRNILKGDDDENNK